MIWDISVPLQAGMPVYGGDAGFKRWLSCDMSKGGAINTSHLDFGAHTGTHVDAPLHMIENGADVTSFPLDSLLGEAVVIEIADPTAITYAALKEASIPREGRVLFKTRNSSLWGMSFQKDFVALELDAARFLAEQGSRLVGIDYLSVEKFGSTDFPVHKTLMKQGTVILEGIDLSRVAPGKYRLFCGPLKLAGADGAPARCLLTSYPGEH